MINIKNIAKKHILKGETPLINSIIIISIIGIILLEMAVFQIARAETFLTRALISNSSASVENGYPYVVTKKVKMVITAYSSTPEQTDNTPLITASGKNVANGIVANNMLPFGSKVRIPELYGNKVFVVEDRMHQRKGKYHLDIWLPEYSQAKNFGAKIAFIEVLED